MNEVDDVYLYLCFCDVIVKHDDGATLFLLKQSTEVDQGVNLRHFSDDVGIALSEILDKNISSSLFVFLQWVENGSNKVLPGVYS